MRRLTRLTLLPLLPLLTLLALPYSHGLHAQEPQPVTIFFNEACEDCAMLVTDMYPTLLAEYGYTPELRDYINERSNRQMMTAWNDTWGVPFELQSHIEAFVGDRLLLAGHIPEQVIRDLLSQPEAYDKLVVWQDQMHGEASEYKVWDFQGEIQTYPIDEPIVTYLAERSAVSPRLKPGATSSRSFLSLFTLISGSAFLDGLNPCAFAVLLFFISFLFTIKKTRASMWRMGLVYVGAIYLAYLLIGLGIAQAIVIAGAPHLMAKVGAYLVISLGVIQLLGLVWPQMPIKMRIPVDTKAALEKWMYKATLPASFVGGFLVGLCTFPCSGGIYVAIIGMLSATTTATQGFGWMLWYNLMFVLPLVILLALASNKTMTEKLQVIERRESRHMKALVGLTMLIVGVVILIFFT